MFSLGYQEMLVIGVVALVVLGPERIPGVLRKIGEYSAILRRYAEDVKRQMELAEAEVLGKRNEMVPPVEPKIGFSIPRKSSSTEFPHDDDKAEDSGPTDPA